MYCTYKVILKCIPVTIVAVVKHYVLHILSVCFNNICTEELLVRQTLTATGNTSPYVSIPEGFE